MSSAQHDVSLAFENVGHHNLDYCFNKRGDDESLHLLADDRRMELGAIARR